MSKNYQKSFSGEKNAGFTLIELLVVVLIIGILAAVALPKYEKSVAKTRFASLMPITKAIKDAQEVLYYANGTYNLPSSLEDSGVAGVFPEGCVFGNQQVQCGDITYKFDPGGVAGWTQDMGYYMAYDHSSTPNRKECWANVHSRLANNLCTSMGGRYFTTFAGSTQKYVLP